MFQLINNEIRELDATHDLKGKRKDERIGQVANGLEGGNAHCVGPYTWGDVNGGGANRGSLYKI